MQTTLEYYINLSSCVGKLCHIIFLYDRESQMAWTPTGDIVGKPTSSPDSSLSSLVN